MSGQPISEESITLLAQRARDTLAYCGNCAQASFLVLQEQFDLPGDAVVKALTPFPGIALRGETCGAVIGSLMALGLVYGRDDISDSPAFTGSLTPARRFCRRFEHENGSTRCEEILEAKMGRKFNLAQQTEAIEYATAGGMQVCSGVVASAVQTAAELISARK